MQPKEQKVQYFIDSEGEKYFFKASGGYQTVTLCRDIDDDEIFELNYKNAYKMLDLLEKAIKYIDEDE